MVKHPLGAQPHRLHGPALEGSGPVTGDAEGTGHGTEGLGRIGTDAVTQPQKLRFRLGQISQQAGHVAFEAMAVDVLLRCDALAGEQILEASPVLLGEGHLQAQGLLGAEQQLLDIQRLLPRLLGQFDSGGGTAVGLQKGVLGPAQPPQSLVHGLRQTDGAALVDQGPADGFTDPPEGIGREAVAAARIKTVDGAHQAEVALLHQVGELELAVGIATGDRQHQPQVRRHHPLPGPLPPPPLAPEIEQGQASLGGDGPVRRGFTAGPQAQLLFAVLQTAEGLNLTGQADLLLLPQQGDAGDVAEVGGDGVAAAPKTLLWRGHGW